MSNDGATILNPSQIESRSLIRFGLIQASLVIAFYLICLGFGVLVGKAAEMTVFMLSVYSIRIYAGGFHANSKGVCFIISIALVFIGFIFLELFIHTSIHSTVAVMLGLIIIFKWAPVQDWHKPLTKNERCVYRRYAIGTSFFWAIAFLFSQACGWTKISSGISASFFVISVVLILGTMKNKVLLSKT